MCGRFVIFSQLKSLRKHFPIDGVTVEITPSYNVAPTQEVFAVVRREKRNHLDKFYWGLVPFRAKDKTIGSRMINARSETVATKPAFRAAFRKRRCLVLADGFYEWKQANGEKQPMFVTLPDGSPLAFAGLWETWDDNRKKPTSYRSCTILTRDASESVMPIHNRMPAILKPEAFGPWLDPENQDVKALQDIIKNQVQTEFIIVPVSKQVNSIKNNSPKNIQPLKSSP
jgi:putative SOS response-associated peptidase YedK